MDEPITDITQVGKTISDTGVLVGQGRRYLRREVIFGVTINTQPFSMRATLYVSGMSAYQTRARLDVWSSTRSKWSPLVRKFREEIGFLCDYGVAKDRCDLPQASGLTGEFLLSMYQEAESILSYAT